MATHMHAAVSDPELESALLRSSANLLAEGRRACACCGRTPLIGETVHHYEDGESLCALCRPRRLSDPVRSELVHHSELNIRVRRIPRAA